METRRWWSQHGSQIILLGLALLAAWLVRQTQGAALFEIYYWVTRPFHLSDQVPAEQEKLVRQINPRIDQLEAKIQELENQNQKLQETIQYAASKKNDKGIIAPVIGRNADHWWKQVTLGRGSLQGIKENDLVVTPGGLAGRIVSVTPNTSKVVLISDTKSRIGVSVSRSRQMGYLKGDGKKFGIMEFFENDPNIKPGDIVVTSVFSHLVPAGWPVGKVLSIDINKTPAPEAIIEFFAPLGSLEWVIVYPNPKIKAGQPQLESNEQQSVEIINP